MTPPTDADQVRAYFKSTSWPDSPGRRYLGDERFGLMRVLASGLAVAPSNLRVCDVGCGGGGDLVSWREFGIPASSLAGTELVHERVTASRVAVPGADIREATDVDLPFATGRFHITTASLVLSTIASATDRERLLHEMSRVTAPGGLVIVYDFVIRKPWNRHVRAMSTAEFTRLWRSPNQVHRVAPFLPVLELACRLPTVLAQPITAIMPRTHRVWVWESLER